MNNEALNTTIKTQKAPRNISEENLFIEKITFPIKKRVSRVFQLHLDDTTVEFATFTILQRILKVLDKSKVNYESVAQKDLLEIIEKEVKEYSTKALYDHDKWALSLSREKDKHGNDFTRTKKLVKEKRAVENILDVYWWELKLLSYPNKKRLAMYYLKSLWFDKWLDFYVLLKNQEKPEWDFWVFDSFDNMVNHIFRRKKDYEYNEEFIASFVEKLWYLNFVYDVIVLLRDLEIWYIDDLEEIWLEEFLKTDYYKWLTWEYLIRWVLSKKRSEKITKADFEKFIDELWIVNRDLASDKNRLEQIEKIKDDKVEEKDFKSEWIDESEGKNEESEWINESEQEEEVEEENPIKSKKQALDLLKEAWYNNILDLLNEQDSVLDEKDFAWCSFEDILLYLTKKWKSPSKKQYIASLNRLAEVLWWKSLTKEIATILKKKGITTVAWFCEVYNAWNIDENIYKDISLKTVLIRVSSSFLWNITRFELERFALALDLKETIRRENNTNHEKLNLRDITRLLNELGYFNVYDLLIAKRLGIYWGGFWTL